MKAILTACGLLWLCGACGGGGGGTTAPVPSASDPAPAPDPNPGQPFGLEARTPLSGLVLPGAGGGSGAFDVENAFPSLTFNNPLYFAGVPGSNQVVVVEQGGRIKAFDNDRNALASRLVLDLSARVLFAGEQGLLGLAFDPDFPQNRLIYVHYSMDGPRRSVIARFTWDAVSDLVALASERIILEVAQPFSNHNGGSLAFGPDGNLFIALGDGGSGGDPQNNAQNLANWLGAILRIDVHPVDASQPYAVPPGNPFAADGEPATLPEIWAYGLRNPYRMSFDRQTGVLWAGDVGQSSLEEIDIVTSGGNYGWSRFEGTQLHNAGVTLTGGASAIAPVHQYGRAQGVAVIGGYVYRGSRIASLFGRYLYSDFGSGQLWALDYDGVSVQANDVLAVVDRPTSLGEDNQGELHVVSQPGTILRLVELTGGGGLPQQLAATGIFADMDELTTAPGLLEYDLNVPFWSDGAFKRRWIGLPGQARMNFAASGNWSFPIGTILVKHFEIALDESNPSLRRRLETRVLINDGATWQGFTYRWNAAQSAASLLAGRETEMLTIVDSRGVSHNQLYTYPGRTDCLQCHTDAAGRALGVRAAQINRDFDFPLAVDNQLRAWNHIGLFSVDIGAAGQYPNYPNLDDETVAVADRARAWLAVNCAQCHRPGGLTGVELDLRMETATNLMNVVDVAPIAGNLGLANALIVAPGAKQQSVLWERLRRLDGTRMPPLASNVVDPQGVDLVGRWIDAL